MNSTAHLPAARTTFRNRILNWALALSLAIASLAPLTARAVAPSSGLSFEDVLDGAHRVAELNTGWQIFKAEGQSMEPLFGKNSLVLTAHTDFKDLRLGMLVVYKDASGDLVAHRLVERADGGWVAKGYNNNKVDPALVTPNNLVGVIFGILNYKSGTDAVASVDANNNPAVVLAKTY